jgi:hypothetical protein
VRTQAATIGGLPPGHGEAGLDGRIRTGFEPGVSVSREARTGRRSAPQADPVIERPRGQRLAGDALVETPRDPRRNEGAAAP